MFICLLQLSYTERACLKKKKRYPFVTFCCLIRHGHDGDVKDILSIPPNCTLEDTPRLFGLFSLSLLPLIWLPKCLRYICLFNHTSPTYLDLYLM